MTPEDITKILEEACIKSNRAPYPASCLPISELPTVVAAIMTLQEGAHPNVDKEELIGLISEIHPPVEVRQIGMPGDVVYLDNQDCWDKHAMIKLSINELLETYYRAKKEWGNREEQKPIHPTLDKAQLIHMVKGTSPSYKAMETIDDKHGFYSGGFGAAWEWVGSGLEKLSLEELWELYEKAIK